MDERRYKLRAVIRLLNLPQSGRQGRLRRAAHAVVARFEGLLGGRDLRARCGFGGLSHLHVTGHLVRRVVVLDLRVAAGVLMPHVRARGGGKHLPPRARKEREKENAC